jgi:thiamine-phosphate pyrophosphorylase
MVASDRRRRGADVRGLYAIVDLEACGDRPAVDHATAVCRGGASVVQLRAKRVSAAAALAAAADLRRVTRAHGVLFVVNDRVDLALLAGADGVHLGQDDLPVEEARRLAPHLLIGLSTHSLDEVRAAAGVGPDYIGFGPVFPTGTKRHPRPVQGIETLGAAARATTLPVIAIGGITLERAAAVRAAGAAGAAVIADLATAPDVEARARALAGVLE